MRNSGISESKELNPIIPVYNDLVEEALDKAVEVEYAGVKTRLIGLEYLLTIMLQTYRPKDRERILMLIDETQIDMVKLQNILKHHGLSLYPGENVAGSGPDQITSNLITNK